MCRLLPLLLFLLFCNATKSNAQQYRWVKGGGSSCNTTSQNNDKITAMCSDGNRNLYAIAMVGGQSIKADTFYRANTHVVTGNCNEPSTLILSYNSCGQMRWAKLFDTYGTMIALDIKYDDAGSIYVVGWGTPNYTKYFSDTAVTSAYLGNYIIKYDTSGKMQWMRFLGANNLSNQLQITGTAKLAIDGQGNPHYIVNCKTGLIISPTVTAQAGIYDIKFSSTGILTSANRLPLDSNWLIKQAIITPRGSMYVHAFYRLPGYENDAIIKYSSTGGILWTDTTGFSGFINGFTYDGANSIYVAGGGRSGMIVHFAGLTASNSYYPIYAFATVAKLDTNGIGRWMTHYDCSQSAVGFGEINVLPNGRLATAGSFVYTLRRGTDSIVTPSTEGQNPCLLIADTSGNTIKLDQLHGTGFYDWAFSTSVDNAGNFYFGGQFESDITASGLGAGINSTGGNTDFFIMKYGYTCNCAIPTANFLSGTPSSKTVSYTYNGTSTGLDSLVWNWGDGQKQKVTSGFTTALSHTFANNGKYTVCVTAYSQCGINTFCKQTPLGVNNLEALGNIKVYPNPVNTYFTIEGAEGATAVLTNSIGQQAMRFSVNTDKQVMDISSLSAGIYILQLTDAKGNRGAMSVVKE